MRKWIFATTLAGSFVVMGLARAGETVPTTTRAESARTIDGKVVPDAVNTTCFSAWWLRSHDCLSTFSAPFETWEDNPALVWINKTTGCGGCVPDPPGIPLNQYIAMTHADSSGYIWVINAQQREGRAAIGVDSVTPPRGTGAVTATAHFEYQYESDDNAQPNCPWNAVTSFGRISFLMVDRTAGNVTVAAPSLTVWSDNQYCSQTNGWSQGWIQGSLSLSIPNATPGHDYVFEILAEDGTDATLGNETEYLTVQVLGFTVDWGMP